jgi:hypothetical protein
MSRDCDLGNKKALRFEAGRLEMILYLVLTNFMLFSLIAEAQPNTPLYPHNYYSSYDLQD